MRIRTRTLLAVAITVTVVWTVSLLIAGAVGYRGLQQRENLEVQATLLRAGEAVGMRVDQLKRTSKDWAGWDEAYQYVKDRNASFAKSNLTSDTLNHLDADFLAFLDNEGLVVGEVSAETSSVSSPAVPSSIQSLLASRPDLVESGTAGVIATPRGPLMVAIEPVTKSDGTGAGAGTFIIGKYLGEDDADQLGQAAGAQVSILPSGAVEPETASRPKRSDSLSGQAGVVVPIDRDTVAGYEEVPGLDGRTGFVVSITQPRTTMILARITGSSMLLAGCLASLALVVGLLVSIDQIVTRRVERLSADVKLVSHMSDFSGRVTSTGDDEITALAEDINSMLAALQESQRELEFLAGHDALTTLYNRHRFEEGLDRELLEATRVGGKGALLWFDIDDFKQINDSLGHAVGDRVLVEFARVLKAETRGYATLARIGGDEFALILPNADRAEAEKTADRLVHVVREHVFEIDEYRIQQRVSIGVALHPDHGMVTDDLLVCADLAMYDAKKAGGDGYRVYSGQRLAPDFGGFPQPSN